MYLRFIKPADEALTEEELNALAACFCEQVFACPRMEDSMSIDHHHGQSLSTSVTTILQRLLR